MTNKLNIGAIILAAGKSRRMGKPKVLLPLNEKPLFMYSCEIASQLSLHPIILISGEHTETIQKQVDQIKNITICYNSNFDEGMSTSLKLGIEALSREVDAALVFLADQPLIPSFVVQSLLNCFEENKNAGVLIVRPTFQGIAGHPVLFSADLFPEFSFLHGDEGGKSIIKKYKEKVKLVPFNNPYWGLDIDTPDDYQKVKDYLKHNPLTF